MQHRVNISIDDVSPHPKSSTKVLKQCYKIIESFPSAKFTLFIPIAYWRTVRPSISTSEPLFISEYPSFCDELRNLSKENFEIAYHGYYHGIPNKSDNDELRDLKYDEAISLYEKMFKEVKKAQLEKVFKKIIRPPAWRMSPEAIKAAKHVGFEILALSPDKYPDGSLDYKEEDKKFGNVVYYNVCPPSKKMELYEKTEIVYHACEWDKNYLDEKHADQLIAFFSTHEEQVDFCFMKGMI